jgi:hypothetical protein
MKIRQGIVAALMVPAILAAQTRTPAPFNGKPLIERMQANVAKITTVAETQRWQANVTMWQTVVGNPEQLSKAELATLKAALLTMQTNVATIERPAEAQRWHANVVLWRAFIAGKSPAGKAPDIDSAFARMKANVAKIAEPAEKERWQANLDLWTAMLSSK